MTRLISGLLGGVAGLLFNPLGHKKKPIQPLPVATRDDAQALQAEDDALRRRKGSAADVLTGAAGAEPGVGSVGKLVVGN